MSPKVSFNFVFFGIFHNGILAIYDFDAVLTPLGNDLLKIGRVVLLGGRKFTDNR